MCEKGREEECKRKGASVWEAFVYIQHTHVEFDHALDLLTVEEDDEAHSITSHPPVYTLK